MSKGLQVTPAELADKPKGSAGLSNGRKYVLPRLSQVKVPSTFY